MDANNKKIATIISASICGIREEISQIQKNLLLKIDERINDLSVPAIEIIIKKLDWLESEKERISEDFKTNSFKIIEEHIHKTILQEFSLDVPEDVVRTNILESAKSEFKNNILLLKEELNNIRNFDLLELSKNDHQHSGLYADFNHIHEDIWIEIRKLESQQNSDKQSSLSFNSEIQRKFETLDDNLKNQIQEFFSHIQQSKDELWDDFSRHSDEIEIKFDSLVNDLKKKTINLESDFGKRCVSIETELSKIGSEIFNSVSNNKIEFLNLLKEKSDKNHSHKEFKNFADKNHSHKEFKVLEKSIENVESQILKKSDLSGIIDEISKKIPEPTAGKDGIGWEFEFDPKNIGVLLFKKETDKKWKKQDLRGPPGISSSSSGGGFGFGGGGGSSGVDITFQNQIFKNIYDLVFNSTHFNVSQIGPNSVSINTTGLGSGSGSSLTTYEIDLSNTEFTVFQEDHNFSIISNIRVFDSLNRHIEVEYQIDSDQTVIIKSNIDLTGYHLTIIGT